MRSIILSLLLALFSFSCGGPRYSDYFPYHDDGTIKPHIALVPLKDSSQSGLPWDLSSELSSALFSELMNHGKLYVLSAQEVGSAWERCPTIDFFGLDLGFAQQFYNADFIVALELIEHSLKPDPHYSVSSGPPTNQLLTMRMRVRVIDLRYQAPKDVLYEVISTDYLISAPSDKIDYSKHGWGWEKFDRTPFGLAHQRMVSCLASRLEESIWSAK